MKRNQLITIVAVALVGVGISGVQPYDRFTWLLEVLPVLVGVPILVATHKRFPLTPLLGWLLLVHALILVVGGHYTYARVPAGSWVQDLLDLERNNYDRFAHFAQGFVPAILVREILIRRSPLVRGKWLFFLVASVCLAFSATYEFIEWWTAIAGGESAEAFLGTQGDVWDTQWDMFLALTGAIVAQLVLAGLHDRQINRVADSGDMLAAA